MVRKFALKAAAWTKQKLPLELRQQNTVHCGGGFAGIRTRNPREAASLCDARHRYHHRQWTLKRFYSIDSTSVSPVGSSSVSPSNAQNNNNNSSLLKSPPHVFAEELKKNEVRRCFLRFDASSKKIVPSHPLLEEIAEFLTNEPNFKQHEAIFFELGRRTDVLLVVFLWHTTRGQAHGGIRMSMYSTLGSFLKDGIRLSLSNGVKAALAGLWIGGGQGLIAELPERKHLLPEFREKLFLDFGDFLSSLNGCFIGTEDLGVNVYDINKVHSRTRYVTGMAEDMGGLGNPCFATGKGVVCAMEAAVDFLGLGTLKDKIIAVQGSGNVGSVVMTELFDKDVGFVYATDCLQKQIHDLTDLLSNHSKSKGRFQIVKVPYGDQSVLSYKCDILSPCAFGSILTEHTIPSIKAKIVCGAANNQLACDVEDQLMMDNGIIYVVDYVANRMGMVIQDAEARGRLVQDSVIMRHFSRDWENSIFVMTKKILQKALDDNTTPTMAASKLAMEFIDQPHPLWPNRTQHIIQGLVDSKWNEDLDFWRRRSNFPSARNIW